MTLKWETQSDWNNTVSESNVIHPDDIVYMDLMQEGFEDYTAGSPPPSPWTDVDGSTTVSTSRAHGGTQSAQFSAASTGGTIIENTNIEPLPYNQLTLKYNETTNNNNIYLRFMNESGNEICMIGTNNPQVIASHGGGQTELFFISPSPDYDEWRKFTLTMDYTNNQYDVFWEDLTGNTSDATAVERAFTNDSDVVGSVEVWVTSGSTLDAWFDDITAIHASSASLITAGKTS